MQQQRRRWHQALDQRPSSPERVCLRERRRSESKIYIHHFTGFLRIFPLKASQPGIRKLPDLSRQCRPDLRECQLRVPVQTRILRVQGVGSIASFVMRVTDGLVFQLQRQVRVCAERRLLTPQHPHPGELNPVVVDTQSNMTHLSHSFSLGSPAVSAPGATSRTSSVA